MVIPYGTDYTATYTGSAMKSCTCESCGQDYVYTVERSATGTGSSILWMDNEGAQDRAARQAEKAMADALASAIDVVPCPACGWYQADMAKILKRHKLYWGLGLSLPFAFILLLWGLITMANFDNNSAQLVTAAAVVATIGIAVGVSWQMMYDPNSGHGGPEAAELAASSKGTLRSEFEAQHAEEQRELEEKFHEGLKQAMLWMVVADGQVKRERAEAAARLYQQVTEMDLGVDNAVREAPNVQQSEVRQRLFDLSDIINPGAKGLFIQASVIVAAADDGISEEEWDVLGSIAGALQMSGDEVNAVLEEMQSE